MLKQLVIAGCLLILLTQAVFQGIMAKTDSQTTDEAVHIVAGYTYFKERDFRLNPEHPPLVKTLSALPLLFINPNLPDSYQEKWKESESFFYDSWKENRSLGEEFFWSSGNDADQLVFWSRFPIVILTLLLGLAVFLITFRHFGAIPSLVATGYYSLSPLINAHGHLVTTDIAISLGVLLSVYTFWQLLQSPTIKKTIWFSLAFGFALLVKHTAIILIPVIVILFAFYIFKKKDGLYTKKLTKRLLSSVGIIIVIIWIGFGFQSRPLPATTTASQDIITAQKQLDTKNVKANSFADKSYSFIRPALTILPGDYVKGLTMILVHTSGGHDTFLFGENSKTGWWYYFPVLMLLKLSIPMLVATAGLVYFFTNSRPKNSLITVLLSSGGLFLLAAMSSKANLGLRHIMPILPLLFIGIGWLAYINTAAKKILLAMFIWLSIIFVFSYPNYLGYFNEFAGAKENNYKTATDSNLDWGQDLKRIRNYIDENKLKKPFVEYGWLGTGALKYYLKDNYQLLSSSSPTIGDKLIIGATAVSSSNYNDTISRCGEFNYITNGTIVCTIEK